MQHPSDVLTEAQGGRIELPVVDHYCGVPKRIQKSLELQLQMAKRLGRSVIDVTMDCEDGAPAGAEVLHAKELFVAVLAGFDATKNEAKHAQPRIAVRIHPVDHPAFDTDLTLLVAPHAKRLVHVMLPKTESLADVQRLVSRLDQLGAVDLPVHCLIESPLAVHNAFAIAAHHRVASLSFGLMDFVSAHGGALGDDALSVQGQFNNPQVLRAKLDKVPSHCVVTEFSNGQAIEAAAAQAKRLGYTRMWSIHPSQIEPILRAFAPNAQQMAKAADLLQQAQAANWAPIQYQNTLHDRASYRLYWQQLQKAKAAGLELPQAAQAWFE
jgi:citrate lyase subunit beta / citryl-CoA lyase